MCLSSCELDINIFHIIFSSDCFIKSFLLINKQMELAISNKKSQEV